MIPADRITIDGDTAWWAGNPAHLPFHLANMNRPCDTCDGFFDTDDDLAYCPGCHGTGRHTFDIEVEAFDSKGPRSRHRSPDSWRRCANERDHNTHQVLYDPWVACPGARTLTVSVVPGMVLPIVDAYTDVDTRTTRAYIRLHRSGNAWMQWTIDGQWQPAEPVTLPPAAEPGMWAVKLAIHTDNPDPVEPVDADKPEPVDQYLTDREARHARRIEWAKRGGRTS